MSGGPPFLSRPDLDDRGSNHGGGYPVGRRRRTQRPWWVLLAIPLIYALVLASVLVALASRHDRTKPAAGAAPVRTPATAPPPEPLLLAADGARLLPLPAGGNLSSWTTLSVLGKDVPVQAVVGDNGIWVGTSPQQVILVALPPRATIATTGARVGQRVSFSGAMVPIPTPPQASAAGFTAQQVDVLRAETQYVQATVLQAG